MVADRRADVPLYERIYSVIRQIPAGRVATYGQIARIVRVASARMVGYALAALPQGSDVPWQRVVNREGKISVRWADGYTVQRQLLEAEGVEFEPRERIDLRRFGWSGPDPEWLKAHGFDPSWL